MNKLAIIALLLCFLVGAALIVSGTYILAGLGWAVLAASVPFFLLSFVMWRGMNG